MAAPSCYAAHEAIQRFLASARDPVVVEEGLDPIPLVEGAFEVLLEGERLSVQAWTSDRTLFRRVTGIEDEAAGRLDVGIQRFGGRPGTLRFLDRGLARTERLTRRASRISYREVFRRFLSRQFPGWRIADLSSDADLQHSFSAAYTRALIRKGTSAFAAIGAPESSDPDGALTYGLIWLDYLRKREPKLAINGLVLLLPEKRERTTCHRIRYLDPMAATFRVFVRAEEWEHEVDTQDAGNIATELAPRDTCLWVPEWLRPVQTMDGVETVETGDSISLRVLGLEFARCRGGEVRFGVGGRRTANERHAGEIANLARELAVARRADNPSHPLYASAPERWLESLVRRQITAIDAGLHPTPLYGQAPTFVSGERGVIDLLAAGIDGRLAVIEVKASEDPHLPLQALEYWARVKWHQGRGEFTARGYFRDLHVTTAPPRILLVAPALQFHSTSETVLRFFAPSVDVVRIGVTACWRAGLKIAFRVTGAESPVT